MDFSHGWGFPVGEGLRKSDWMSFFGSYIFGATTFLVSVTTILQSRFFMEQQRSRDEELRKKSVQPVFVLSIDCIKGQYIVFTIENVGAYPITNVSICGNYLYHVLKTNDPHNFSAEFKSEISKASQSNIIIDEAKYEKAHGIVPQFILFQYNDVDGRYMQQNFCLADYSGKLKVDERIGDRLIYTPSGFVEI